METVVLVIHLLLAVSLVGVVLLQRSEGGGLGLGGGGTMGGLMTARAGGNLLTRTTAILAGCFMTTSIVLVLLAGTHRGTESRLQQLIEQNQQAAPAAAPSLDDRPAPVEAPGSTPLEQTPAPTPQPGQ